MRKLLQNVLRDAGGGCQHLAVRRGHGRGQDACQNEARQNGCQHPMGADEACNADDDGLAGRTAQKLQSACLGHAKAHHADDDGSRHGNDHPDGGNAAAEHQLLLVLNGHKAEQDVGHSKVTEAPCHGGYDVQQAVAGGTARGGIVAGHHGQVAGDALGVLHHSAPAACHADAIHQHGHQCHRHDDGLDEVGGGHGTETAQDGVAHDDEGRHQHGRHVIHPKQAVEQLAAGRKARGRVGHEKHDDDDCAQCVEQVALVVEAQGQKLRHRDGVEVGRVAAEPPGHDEPVEPGTHWICCRQSQRPASPPGTRRW